jgi:hypothetical protein
MRDANEGDGSLMADAAVAVVLVQGCIAAFLVDGCSEGPLLLTTRFCAS